MRIRRKAVTRPPVKQDEIVDELRGRIMSGDLGPGARLPNRKALREQFHVSPVTVQRALDRLLAQGFVRARARLGTFVVDSPPHLHHFGLVVPFLHREHRSQFYDALSIEAHRLAKSGTCSITVYADEGDGTEACDYEMLLADLREHGLAGLIFATIPNDFKGTLALTDPTLHRVACMAPDPAFPFPAIQVLRDEFFRRGLEFMAQKGCRRVAVLDTKEGNRVTPPGSIIALARSMGMSIPPYWYQSVPLAGVDCGRGVMHLLFGDGAVERPDGLLIADDNLVEDATLGLKDAGYPGRSDLKLVAFCNYPWLPNTHFPATWLGVDTREILRDGIALLGAQQRGEEVPVGKVHAPVFVEELGEGVSPENAEEKPVG